MSALSSVIQYIKYLRLRRARRKQKLTAFLMMAHSGVIRASHVELHYLPPIARTPSSRSQPAVIGLQLIHTIEEYRNFMSLEEAKKFHDMAERMKRGMEEHDRKQSHYSSYNQKRGKQQP
jgi:hypothetical protein